MRAKLYRLLTVASKEVGFQKASILCITYLYVRMFSNNKFQNQKKIYKNIWIWKKIWFTYKFQGTWLLCTMRNICTASHIPDGEMC